MKNLKKFENFTKDLEESWRKIRSNRNKGTDLYSKEERELEPYEVSEENAKLLSDMQKNKGGVIGFQQNENAIKYFTNLGYNVKYIKYSDVLKDDQIMSDIENRAKVNYVVAYLPDDGKLEILGV